MGIYHHLQVPRTEGAIVAVLTLAYDVDQQHTLAESHGSVADLCLWLRRFGGRSLPDLALFALGWMGSPGVEHLKALDDLVHLTEDVCCRLTTRCLRPKRH